MLKFCHFRIFAISAVLLLLMSLGCARPSPPQPALPGSCDPGNAAYLIEGTWVRLTAGRAVTDILPGAAFQTTTTVLGPPLRSDLDEDGLTDAVLILIRETGGSGTFFYAAVALGRGGACQGTNAVFLGDRIIPGEITILNGVVAIHYLDRQIDQPMAAHPSLPATRYLTLEKARLVEIPITVPGEKVSEGWVTIGHEVRTFRPCSQDADLWLLGDSPALSEIIAAHRLAAADDPPYGPVFMVLAGTDQPAPREGFGADYEAAFRAARLVRVLSEGYCRKELIRLDAPAPRSRIASPLRVHGEALGPWFFEGDFPLVLTDARGRVIGKGYATAQDPWMTREFVPFEGLLTFRRPASGGWGMLILKKDNPTGLPEHDDALSIPVRFE